MSFGLSRVLSDVQALQVNNEKPSEVIVHMYFQTRST